MATSLPTVVSWRAPAWATSTTLIDGGVAYSRSAIVAGLLSGRDGETTIEIRLVQHDDIEVGEGGLVQVMRAAAEVVLEDQRFTIEAAADLRDALGELLVLARGRSDY